MSILSSVFSFYLAVSVLCTICVVPFKLKCILTLNSMKFALQHNVEVAPIFRTILFSKVYYNACSVEETRFKE